MAKKMIVDGVDLKLGYILCEEHGAQKGWAICEHVRNGTEVAYRQAWSEKCGGLVCCKPCGELLKQDKIETFDLCCEEHLKAFGLYEGIN